MSYLKIDRSLVAGLPDDLRSQRLVRAILTIARELGVDVISEGIETRGQADHLIAAGSALLQGYLLGAPMSADRLEADFLVGAGTAITPGGPDDDEAPSKRESASG